MATSGKWLAGLASALLLASGSASAQVVRGGPPPGPLPLFPPDSWWNLDISTAPVDPNSGTYIAYVGVARGMHPDFGGDAGGTGPDIYGMVTVTVPGDLPLEPLTFDYAGESGPGAPGRPPGYPIPIEAKTQAKWIEGGYPGNSGAGGWTSADAAGLAILPGLVRYDEAFGTAPIGHAFRCTVRSTNGYVWPASHRAGSTAGALPMGARPRPQPDRSGSSPSRPAASSTPATRSGLAEGRRSLRPPRGSSWPRAPAGSHPTRRRSRSTSL